MFGWIILKIHQFMALTNLKPGQRKLLYKIRRFAKSKDIGIHLHHCRKAGIADWRISVMLEAGGNNDVDLRRYRYPADC